MEQEPQFGTPLPGRTHRDRPAAFGILENEGLIALVRVTMDDGTPPFVDLPGGALDPGEDAAEAVIREFGEETGLAVETGEPIGRAAQYFVVRGEPVNNRCAFFVVRRTDGAAEKVEDDHQLVWVAVDEAIASLRHDAHAWALAAWMRLGANTPL